MSNLKFAVAVILWGSGVSLSCGGSGGGGAPTCAAFTACGGNVVGTWKITGFCAGSDSIAPPPTCPSATITITSTAASGTVTLGADGTESTSASISIGESAHFPSSCITSDQCTQYQTALTQSDTNATCSYSSSGCQCSVHVTTQDATAGTYTTSGSDITITEGDATTGGTPETDSYCVSGNTFSIKSTDTDGNVTIVSATK